MNDMDIQKLYELSIYELRDIGRRVGVYLPTTYKKDDLINEINLISSGEKEPYKRKGKLGRPPKTIDKITPFLSSIIPGYNNDINSFKLDPIFNTLNYEDDIYGKLSSSSINTTLSSTQSYDTTIVTGLLDILNNGNGIIVESFNKNNPKKFVFLSSSEVVKNGLSAGDYITCSSTKLSDEQPYIFNSLISINGIDFNPEQSNKNIAINNSLKSDKLHILNYNNQVEKEIFYSLLPIKTGERIVLVSPNRLYAQSSTYNILQNIIKNEDLYVVSLILDGSSEVLDAYSKLQNAQIFSCQFGENYKVQEKIIYLTLCHIEKMQRLGKNILLTIDNLNLMTKILEASSTENNAFSTCEISSNALNKVKNIFSLAKNGKEGSLTILGQVCSFPTQVDATIVSEFDSAGSIKIVCDEECFFKNKIPLNLTKTQVYSFLESTNVINNVKKYLNNNNNDSNILLENINKCKSYQDFISLINFN